MKFYKFDGNKEIYSLLAGDLPAGATEVVANKTEVGNLYANILLNLNSYLPIPNTDLMDEETEKRLTAPIVRARQAVRNYLNDVVKDTLDVNQANQLIEILKDNGPLRDVINNYLENRDKIPQK